MKKLELLLVIRGERGWLSQVAPPSVLVLQQGTMDDTSVLTEGTALNAHDVRRNLVEAFTDFLINRLGACSKLLLTHIFPHTHHPDFFLPFFLF